jgi:DNA polymerase III epsilon subunit-like protein
LIWIDLETTGLDPVKNDIIEICVYRLPYLGATEVALAYYSKVQMERPSNASAEALRINGYTEERWSGAPVPRTVWHDPSLHRILRHGIMAGHNVSFDVGFLQETLKRHGVDLRLGYHKFDTVSLVIEQLPWLTRTSVSLSAVCVAMGIPITDAHSAQGDISRTIQVANRLQRASFLTRLYYRVVGPRRVQKWLQAGKPAVWEG